MDKHTIIGLVILLAFLAIGFAVVTAYPKVGAVMFFVWLYMTFCNSTRKGN